MVQPQDRYVESNGVALHYRDWGGDGRPIVLLHGLASNARIWDLVAPRLTDDGRVLAFDQRGHGLSDKPETGYGFAEVTADLAAALDALALRDPVVVGHSWGANVAAVFAAEHPERAAAIGLIDGGVFDLSSNMSWEDAERTMAPPRLAGTPRSRFLEMIREHELGAIWNDEIEAAFMGNFEVREDDTIAPWLTFDRHMMILRAIYGYHPEQVLQKIRVPTTIMPCIGDAASAMAQRKRDAVARAHALLADGHVTWFEDAIHDVPVQKPEDVAAAIIRLVAMTR